MSNEFLGVGKRGMPASCDRCSLLLAEEEDFFATNAGLLRCLESPLTIVLDPSVSQLPARDLMPLALDVRMLSRTAFAVESGARTWPSL